MRLTGPGRLELGAESRDQQSRQSLDLFHSKIEQFARAWISPMQILEDHQHGLPASQTSELAEQCLERLFLFALWGEVEIWVAAIKPHGQRLGHQLHVFFRGRIR